MITGELKSTVDRIWDTMWSGGISNPLTVIEQLTYLLFIKRLDEIHTLKERKVARTGKPIDDPIFGPDQDHLRWSRFRETAPEKMFATVKDEVFPFIKSLGRQDREGEETSTYTHHMRDALFIIQKASLLASVVDQLDGIDMSDRDTKGDLYEYMLGKIASAGQNGQFRTPRHIIKLMVEMMNPTPKDVICDPACGTAGFLIAASQHLVDHHSDAIYRDDESRRKFNERTFHGYDFDSTMLRIGSMNMMLHGVENPDIRYRDSLAEDHADDTERFSLILANPPFSGSLDYESTSKALLETVRTRKTELLFMSLFRRLLKQGGRAAVIVPAGVVEVDSSREHLAIRKMLIDEIRLEAVVNLPHWVFRPYASVDTSILVFSKGGTTDNVWFYRVENDGFADDAQKSPVTGSDLPEVLSLWRSRHSFSETGDPTKYRFVTAEEIRANDYDLCPAVYLSGYELPPGAETAPLGSLFDLQKGPSGASSALEEGPYPFVTSAKQVRRSERSPLQGPAICIPTVSATGHGHASLTALHYVEGQFDAASITAVLTPKSEDTNVQEIYYYLLAHKDELLVPLMRGATNKSLTLGRLSQLEIPLFSSSGFSASVNRLVEIKKQVRERHAEIGRLEEEHDRGIEQLRGVLNG